MILWQPAQVGTEACTLKRTRAVESPRALANSNLEKSTSPGGEGTVWHNMISRSALPRMVGELRPAGECKAVNATWVKMPPRGSLFENSLGCHWWGAALGPAEKTGS